MSLSLVEAAEGALEYIRENVPVFLPHRMRAAMADFKTVCRLSELREGEGKCVVVGGKILALFRTGDTVRAIDDACPHMGFSLAGGAVEDGVVTCPLHAWQFRLDDGTWLSSPKVKVGCYQVRVEGDEVRVEVSGGRQS
jgi:nitrite reductase (NADH) small subunit